MRHFYIVLIFLISTLKVSHAQNVYRDQKAVVYEEMFDDPHDINKLFIGIQPLYGELFATNVNAGFGIEAHYFHPDKFDIKAQFRRPWTNTFYDINNDAATKNDRTDYKSVGFSYYEVGVNYYVRKKEVDTKTTLILFKRSYRANKWASRVPLKTDVACTQRRILGVRTGIFSWTSTIDLNNVARLQEFQLADMTTAEGLGLPTTFVSDRGQTQEFTAYSSMSSTSVYLGVAITKIVNMAVNFDTYEPGTDDSIRSFYFDVLYAPILKIEDVIYQDQQYDVDLIKLSSVGFRLGMDGKFNRTLGWSYGAELGYRPSFQKGTFFTHFKLGIPMFGTKLDNSVEVAEKR